MTPPEIFSRSARRRHRDRAAKHFADHAFVREMMVEGILERLAAVRREFHDALDLGCFDGSLDLGPGTRVARLDAGFGFARAAGGVQGDEDRLPFADGSFDLVISAGVLDQVNDLPGALTLVRRVLRPDGLFLGAFVGAGSLPTLRAALRAGEPDRPAARLHPQIDVRSAGDLLMRAGFALPVADSEALDIGYGDLGRLLADLRGSASTNVLVGRQPLGRAALARTAAAFTTDGERAREHLSLVYLTGWAPDASQPQPARRGSATASLAAVLKKTD
ncbi:methyltransferase domain-containing protein [Sphingomonas aerophila]|uniref:SAM-dependent methyltransferase n=1 Tax=Sphingomonas aerophila TaxID=1344948 RepID=A0A7W9BBZ6_9SPHN|nr:methyltransferase domain-containing protein [Sphingomonas aerophila]MBB5714026.1 SAM-dependent methyltransferase [Sphingomonas aerophila]